jgi:hypothetical protein
VWSCFAIACFVFCCSCMACSSCQASRTFAVADIFRLFCPYFYY